MTSANDAVRAGYGPLLLFLLTLAANAAPADGLSNYLPLNLEPETERLIERVLILADEPILKRPFPVKLVEDALPQACEVDPVLCARVKRYLQRYSRDYALTHASLTASKTKGADPVLPNSYGETSRSKWELSGQAFVQPNDYMLANVGAVAYSGRTNAAGSFLSFGFNWAQIDIGYRDHWLSPMTDSSTLVSTEAPVTPSVTLSNSEPITRLGFQYEFFLTELSKSDRILYNGVLSSGHPRVFGTQLSIEPIPGWSLGINRLLEYGGGTGLPRSAHFLLSDFFKPSGLNQTQGNQQASYVSRFIYPGKTPFALYAQYAGEDNSNGGSYLLGNASLSVGIDLPRIGPYFDATFEMAEWQNIWYVHNIFLDGMTNDGLVLGNWGADQRHFGDGVGARSLMLRVGWVPEFGGYLEERVRTLANQTYFGGDNRTYQAQIPPFSYHKYRDLMVRYTRLWKDLTLGGEFVTGKDIDGKSFSRLSGFVRYGGDERTRDDGGASAVAGDAPADREGPKGAEVFVDAGVNANQVRVDLEKGLPITTTKLGFGPHLGFGARRAVTERGDLGARVEFDDINGHTLIGFRAVDYRHRYDGDFPVTLNLFLGAARYGLATPAMSLYAGAGTTWRNILPKWDLTLDARYAQNVARDHVLASDPQGVRPESFYKISSAVLYISRRF